MQISLNFALADNYKSPSQKIRAMTEDWVKSQIFCPSCGSMLKKYPNNKPVADYYCPVCQEDYELKSNRGKNLAAKVVDGAYRTMIERLQDTRNPSFFFLNYEPVTYQVFNFIVVPKYFFTPAIIEKRKPLTKGAKRQGWVGCNILVNSVPESGKIFYIKNKRIEPKRLVLDK